MNLIDKILNTFILGVMTKDEWHTAVLGFSDGLSFEMEGRWMRRRLATPETEVAGIGKKKIWYYRVPYVVGEFAKLGIMLFLAQHFDIANIMGRM